MVGAVGAGSRQDRAVRREGEYGWFTSGRFTIIVDRCELDQLEAPLAARRGDVDLVTFLLVEDGAPDRRGGRDQTFLGVSLPQA